MKSSESKPLRAARSRNDDYVPFVLEDYVDNPVALARIKAKITQAELARRMDVSQAYVSKRGASTGEQQSTCEGQRGSVTHEGRGARSESQARGLGLPCRSASACLPARLRR